MPNYVGNGAWGTGIGAPLSQAQFDGNTWEFAQAIADILANAPLPNEIVSISVSGTALSVTMADATVFGPFPIQVPRFGWRGDWGASTLYAEMDVVIVAAQGLYMVLEDHTSAATFDEAAVDVDLNPLYFKMLAVGASLSSLDSISDVDVSGAAANDMLVAVSVGSPATIQWQDRTPDQVTALLSVFAGDTGSPGGGIKGLVPAPADGDAAAGKYLAAGGGYSVPAGSAGITALTGDVTATGPGSVAATLANTAVTPGSYTLTALTVDAKGRLTAASNGIGDAISDLPLATLPVAGLSLLEISETDGGSPATYASKHIRISDLFASLTVLQNSIVGPGTSFNYNNIKINTDDALAGAGFAAGLTLEHYFGGAATTGGREAFYSFLRQTAITAAGNTNRNYVALQGHARTDSGDGGTGLTTGTAKGAYFGSSSYVQLVSGATNVLNATGSELNWEVVTGASSAMVSGLSTSYIATHAVAGALVDAHWDASGQAGGLATKHLIFLNDYHGAPPLAVTGCVIGTDGVAHTIATGIDLSSYTISGDFLKSANTTITGAGNITTAGALDATSFLISGIPLITNGGGYTNIAAGDGSQVAMLLGGAGDPANYYDRTTHVFRATGGGSTFATITSAGLTIPLSTPASAAATGVVGTIKWDAGFIYVCVATDTWERVAIATW